jgi:hypothetical protein
MLEELHGRYALESIPFPVMQGLSRVPRAAVGKFLGRVRDQ